MLQPQIPEQYHVFIHMTAASLGEMVIYILLMVICVNKNNNNNNQCIQLIYFCTLVRNINCYSCIVQ